MANTLVFGSILLVFALATRGAVAQDCTDLSSVSVSNGAPGPDCFDINNNPFIGAGLNCSVTCNAGFTSYPPPVIKCNSGTPVAQGLCIAVCPGDPPPIPGVTWVAVADQQDPGNPPGPYNAAQPEFSCTDSVAEFSFCLGRCDSTNSSTDPFTVAVTCTQDVNFNPVWDMTTGGLFGADACSSNATCNEPPPYVNNGTLWDLSCTGLAAGKRCNASCRSETKNFWATGNDTDQFPSIQCVENATAPGGASYDLSTLEGNCSPVCNRPDRIWIRNGSWPSWCEAVDSPIVNGSHTGGLTKLQICTGVCEPGFFGSPKWQCNINSKFKNNRTGDCFPVIPGVRGGCWGPVPYDAPLNTPGWDVKCWDMRSGWNCTTECNGDWPSNTTDPTALGYGTAESPFLPHVNCVYDNTSLPYLGRYTEVRGQCVRVCRGALPELANGDWPADCLPRDGGYGGRRTNNTRCLGVCQPGFTGTPFVECTGQGWSGIFGGCLNSTEPPAEPICQGQVQTSPAAAGNAQPWPATCANQPLGYRCNTTCTDDTNQIVSGGTFGTATLDFLPWTVCGVRNTTDNSTIAQWRSGISGTCYRVCAGSPPVFPNVNWDPRCTRQPGGFGGVRPTFTCSGTCAAGFVGVPQVRCIATDGTGTAWRWATSLETGTGCTVNNTVVNPNVTITGFCPNVPAVSQPTNTRSPPWPSTCINGLVGTSCKAVCNAGYASGSLSRTVPTSVCTADAATASGGRWGAVSGICTQVCLSPPPPTVGVIWNAACMPVATGPDTGVGGTPPGATCFGRCAAGFASTTGVPRVPCAGRDAWGGVTNGCRPTRHHRHLLTGKQL